MKTKTPEKEVAACLGQQAAGKNYLRSRAYRKTTPMSSVNLKELIGELLLYLQTSLGRNERQEGWGLFVVLLKVYIEDGYLGVASKSVRERPEATKAETTILWAGV